MDQVAACLFTKRDQRDRTAFSTGLEHTILNHPHAKARASKLQLEAQKGKIIGAVRCAVELTE